MRHLAGELIETPGGAVGRVRWAADHGRTRAVSVLIVRTADQSIYGLGDTPTWYLPPRIMRTLSSPNGEHGR